MIKNIVFDMGNVLIRFAPHTLVQSFTKDKVDQKLLAESIFGSIEWLKFDKGLMSKEEVLNAACQKIPQTLHEPAKNILENWYRKMTPITEMLKVVDQLKENYQLFLLSNTSVDFYQFKHIIPGIEKFDGIFISCEWRLLKPEHAIYQAFYNHFQLNPAECFFIDDSAANILAAEETGMKGFVFKDNPKEMLAKLAELNETIDTL